MPQALLFNICIPDLFVVPIVSMKLLHHSPDQLRLDPQLVQGFHFEGAEVGGMALDAPDSSPMHLLWSS